MIDEDHNVDDGITRREDQIFLPRRQNQAPVFLTLKNTMLYGSITILTNSL